MGSTRSRNSTRAGKARSVKQTKTSKGQSPAAMKRRLAKRKRPSTSFVEGLREAMRDDRPERKDIGSELRTIAKRLGRVEAYLMVAGSSLDGNPSYSGYVTVLLRSAVGNLLFKQIRALEDLAARCDGGPPSERDHEDDPDEDDDMDAEGDE